MTSNSSGLRYVHKATAQRNGNFAFIPCAISYRRIGDMTDDPKKPDTPDYKDTVFLPKTDFPMKAGLPQKEPGILAQWRERDIYGTLRKTRAGREKFIFHDGPPYANGNIHIGHALNKTLKDIVVRTQSLLGKDAPFVPGWDCHGLPIEWKIEEQYRKKKRNKDEVPPKEFRAECRQYAKGWVETQSQQFQRLGINADWAKPYLTMDFSAEATIVSELMKFAETGQLYRGAKPVMWSPVERTALAEAEVEYADVTSTQIDVAFKITKAPNAPELVGAHAVIWTTTPWTIPVNQALAYTNSEFYMAVETEEGVFVVARPLLSKFLERTGVKIKAEAQTLADELLVSELAFTFKQFKAEKGKVPGVIWYGFGSDLAGAKAAHPMAKYFCHSGESRNPDADGAEWTPDQVRGDDGNEEDAESGPAIYRDSPNSKFYTKPRPFLDGSAFVTIEAGTGLVHMAPDHGEDDFDLCKANGINPVFAVDAGGQYREDWAWLPKTSSVINKNFNGSDGPICNDLREAGALLSAGEFHHSYPHSWRSKAKIIYRCTQQWFAAMDENIHYDRSERNPSEARQFTIAITPATVSSSTLRKKALKAIAETRFVPEKGRNRIGSMVEGRPDWVLSRQRAWGVPITLFVNRKSNEYLVDAQVNARIIAAVGKDGVDAWEEPRAQEFLGDGYAADDYEMVTDILDVWFDSGCTHVFTLESGKWPEQQWPADLYLEGSDQHRGWFQSSLLESCATRGRAPYNAVLTHGFTMDAKGMKMSKSLGNTVDPLKVMEQYGADIIRLWVASIDYTEDHRIGDEILRGVSDSYRKLRNTFRYMLGALGDYDESERVDIADMPELERYVLHLLAELDAKLRRAVDAYDFGSYMRLISEFANEDLSAFFFDIRKDCLYCDAPGSIKRRSARTVLDIVFHAMVRYAAPVLVFTAEEIWQSRYGKDAESVHLLEWPEVDSSWQDAALSDRWAALRVLRERVNEAIEPLRRDKVIRSSLQAEVTVPDRLSGIDLAELFISADVHEGSEIAVSKTAHSKCGRCWRLLPDVTQDGALCDRCHSVLES